jgi:hypothetical protein
MEALRKPIGGAILAILLGAPGIAASDFHVGLEAYQNGDFSTARVEWEPLAEQGLVEAQFNLGLLYYHGKGVDADHAVAADWYRRAAEQDYRRAQYELAAIYEIGDGVRADLIQAYKWFRLCSREEKYRDARKRKKRVAQALGDFRLAQAELQVREWIRVLNASRD